MTRDTSVAALDLDTQVQLLSRIQFLTRFSSNLIQITGREGAGKTWLAQRYLEQWAQGSNQTLLLCHRAQSDSQHRSIILKQLVAQPVFNDQDPLQESVERMLGSGPANLLLVIDDAHLLSATLIAELWALVQQAQNMPGWQINVLLFSQSGRLDKYLSQVSHGQGAAPLELEIVDFSEQEVQTFVEVIFATDRLDAHGRRALRDKAAASSPVPGALMQLEQTEQTNMASSRSRTLSPMTLLAVLLVVAAAGLAFVFFPADDSAPVAAQTESPEPADEARQALTLSTGQVEEELSESLPEPISGETALSRDVTDTINDDSHRLPQEISLEGLTVGRSDDNQRVVLPSDVVDAMITEQELGGSGAMAVADQPAIEEAVSEAIQPADTTEQTNREIASVAGEPASESEPGSDALPEPVSVAPAEQAEEGSTNLGAALKGVDKRHYALQLAALKSLAAANKFIAEYQIANIATIYETRRNGEPWFIVISGDYPNIVAARRAETQLPERLQVVQPWVKSYAQIHREIERVK
ncbi:AAA family ATPase [Photobacterium alginatilyticum]|uniref:NACHT domain-containing protein n=1 Tax=Photobacterium alginatilyticum TaxID=1775171 RepID=A0ABW9YSQ8_9GAMM|nr:AAA family ATPase [Photobacterium alginatilyticum]NBI55744.1 NACHT domain-containing protein [Photobacterium alginatilyticum]